MFEAVDTLTGRLGLWAQMMRNQVMKGLPIRLESDLSEAKAEIERLREMPWLPICDYVRAKHGAHVIGWNEKVGVTEFLLHDDGWTVAAFNGQVHRGAPEKFMPLPSPPQQKELA